MKNFFGDRENIFEREMARREMQLAEPSELQPRFHVAAQREVTAKDHPLVALQICSVFYPIQCGRLFGLRILGL